MKIELDPVERAVDEIDLKLIAGQQVLEMDQADDYPAAVALAGAAKAVAGLRAVLAALADLEPGPALTINDALRRGLGVNW